MNTFIAWTELPYCGFETTFLGRLWKWEDGARDVTHFCVDPRFVFVIEVPDIDMHDANALIIEVATSVGVDPYSGKVLSTRDVPLRQFQVPVLLPAAHCWIK